MVFQGRNTKTNKLCLRNIPENLPDDELEAMCKACGDFQEIKRIQSKGLAFIAYESENDAEAALQKIYMQVKLGIRVDYAMSKNDANREEFGNYRNRNGSNGINDNRSSDNRGPFKRPDGETMNSERYMDSSKASANSYEQRDCQSSVKKSNQNPMESFMDRTKSSQGQNGFSKPLEEAVSTPVHQQTQEKEAIHAKDMANSPAVTQIKICNLCCDIANLLCERCNDSYCSVICQTKDWSRHRIVCFPMPRLVPASRGSTIWKTSDPPKNVSSPAQGSNACAPNKNSYSVFDLIKTNKSSNKNGSTNSVNSGGAAKLGGSTHSLKSTGSNGGVKSKSNEHTDNKAHSQNSGIKIEIVNNAVTKSQSQVDGIPKKPINVFEALKRIEEDHKRSSVELKPETSPVVCDGPKTSSQVSSTQEVVPSPAAPPQVAAVAVKPKTVPETDPILPNEKVIVTYVRDHTVIYVRAVRTTTAFIKLSAAVLDASKTAKSLTKLPERNDMVMAPFVGDYYRALVLRTESKDAILIVFIDFGNIERVNFDVLKEIPEDLGSFNKIITKILLKPVPENAKEAVVKLLNKFSSEETQLVLKFNDNLCDLILENGKSFLDEITAAETAETKKPEPPVALPEEITEITVQETVQSTANDDKMDNRILKSQIEVKLIEGQNVRLLVLGNSLLSNGFISVLNLDDGPIFEGNESKIMNYCSSIKEGSYIPKLHEVCLVKSSDGNWCRSECSEADENNQQFGMLSLDYGNFEQIAPMNIRALPKELAFPCITDTCLIDELTLKLEDPNFVKKLTETLCLYETFAADSIKYDPRSEVTICRIPTILNNM